MVAIVPPGLRYDEAAARLRALLAAGTRIGAVLVAGDEGVLVANRLPGGLPVIDQVDADAAAACRLVAVEVQPPGHTLRLLADPVALGARLGLREDEAGDAAAVCRALTDHANAVIGLGSAPLPAADLAEPWAETADGRRLPLRTACAQLAGWPVGAIRAFGTDPVDDLFAVDLAAAAEAATARPGSTGRAVLVAALSLIAEEQAAPVLGDLLGVPVHSPVAEPAAARLGALTTPGARDGAVVVDLGAGTIDVIGPRASVVAAGAGDLLTGAVAQALGIPRATADWVKRGPCLRVDGGQRFEAEDGTRGFLPVAAPASAAGMLAVDGPGGPAAVRPPPRPGRMAGDPAAAQERRAGRELPACGADTRDGRVQPGSHGRRPGWRRGTARRDHPFAAARRGRRPGQRRRHLRGRAARPPLRGRPRPGPDMIAVGAGPPLRPAASPSRPGSARRRSRPASLPGWSR